MKTLLIILLMILSAPNNDARLFGEIDDCCEVKTKSCVFMTHNSSGCQYYTEIDHNNKFEISNMRKGKYTVFVSINNMKYEPFNVEISSKMNFMVLVPNMEKKQCTHYFEFK